ncbi:hypothetical protein NQ317_003248 [Molorchus minor]|uniref:Ig-like domain-containing protein n=1 Tax=Molorchus minor TaxID=1323400 RepID=A0ABQ9J6L1_9CUCU|nr:hypothetical protein NQ317_003248 [Molorchus minor]
MKGILKWCIKHWLCCCVWFAYWPLFLKQQEEEVEAKLREGVEDYTILECQLLFIGIKLQKNYYENKDGAKIVKASHFEFEYMLGRKITFFCMAQGYPRPEITWFKDGIELIYHQFFQVHEWPIGNDTVKSKMEIDPTTQKDAGYYECQANNKYSIDSRGFRTDYVMITY